jgi:5-dehydro-2-deoxygluconokinase
MGRIGYDLHAVEQNRPLAQVEHFSRHLGGSSANIAIGLSRLGLRVGIISCLGKDALADYLLGFLEQEGVDTQHVGLAEGYNTSLCLTEVCPPDRFGQVFYRRDAADTQVTLGLQQKDYLQQARLFVTNGTSLCVSPAREATQQALQAARAAGQQTALDIDYRESSWPSAAEAGRQARLAMAWVDVVIGNEPELALLTEEAEPGAQVQRALDLGARLVVRKLGSWGVEARAAEESHRVPAVPVETVSTIGAGDGFASGFLYALYRNFPLLNCLRYGNAAAAVVVSRVSCSDAMPRLREVEEKLRTYELGEEVTP